MSRQLISTRYKNIKEKGKKYNSGTFITKIRKQLSESVHFFFFLNGTEDFQ